jgi:hypothetical protein
MTAFDGLIKGGTLGKDIVAGKPEESLLIQRIKGEETPKMPPGQRNLSEASIAKIEQWVKDGARLDAGIDAAAPMAKYAPSAEDLRKAQLAKMKPEERDKKTEDVGLERIKKAAPSSTMTVSKSAHFLLLSELPKERAASLLKAMESQYTFLDRLLGNGRTPGLNFSEKLSLYVFKERRGFTEYVRTIENQEVDASEQARGKLTVESPYIVAVDPLSGQPEPATPVAKRSRSKKSSVEEAFTGPERKIAGLLTEQLTSGALNAAGKPPRWLTLGAAAFLASKLEPASPYYRRIRAEAVDQVKQGWARTATEALGDTTKPETQRAVGYAICDWLYSNDANAFSSFTKGMLEGGPKLDDVLGASTGMDREAFLEATNSFVQERYGVGR